MFLDRENWLGSFYELAIEYSPPREDERLLKAIHALWSCQQLEGPVDGPYGEQHVKQGSRLPLSLEPEDYHNLYGKIKLAEGNTVGCLSVTVREKGGSDWLDLCIPTGMLGLAYQVEYPLFPSTNPWLSEIDHVFMTIAEKIYACSPFNLAIIGEEVSGYRYAQTITVDDLVRGGYLVPPELVQNLRPPVSHVNLPSGLCWFPDK
jgi:hypothetical protein